MIGVVDRNWVEICGYRVDRPARVPPSQWLAYWEGCREFDPELPEKMGKLQAEVDEANRDLDGVENTIQELHDTVASMDGNGRRVVSGIA